MTIKEIMEKERWAAEEAFIRGNFDALDEVFDPDTTFHAPPFPDYKGLERFKQSLMNSRQLLTDIRWKWDEVIIEGNTAVQRFTFSAKHTGTSPMFPVQPTGKELVLEGCTTYHIKNGKIVEFIEYSDYLGFFQQLGIVPPIEQSGP
ncbi:ester cyclase [Thermodesulfobacteriota bacterium]